MPIPKRPIFIDKDGVIIEADGSIEKIKAHKLIPHAIEGLKLLAEAGNRLFIITNQSGINRGIVTKELIERKHKQLEKKLMKNGIKIHIYYCPHVPREDCNCRKPKDGLIQTIKKEHIVDLKKGIIIGDRTTDLLLGRNLGMKTILVKTGFGGKDKEVEITPDFITENLLDAAKIIISHQF